MTVALIPTEYGRLDTGPLDIALITKEYGRLEIVHDEGDAITTALFPPRDWFVLLRYIDQYANTIFNSYQMQSVILEWEAVLATTELEAEKVVLERVLTLMRKCRDNRDLYLYILGW